jgi:hypothetical protein
MSAYGSRLNRISHFGCRTSFQNLMFASIALDTNSDAAVYAPTIR